MIFSDLAMEQICVVLMQNAVDAADPNQPNRLVVSGRVADHGVELSFCDDCGGWPVNCATAYLNRSSRPKAAAWGWGWRLYGVF